MSRVEVNPKLLSWALERSGKSNDKYERWVREEIAPTLKQLENFAKANHVPIGYLFLPEPPQERLPIPDFRTLSGDVTARPSPDLLDTIYAMQRRQAWLRETLAEGEAEPLAFVGSARLTDEPEAIGREMRRIVGLGDGWAGTVRSWREAVSELRRAIERLGVMAVVNGVVGNNTYRKLDISEFRGFALCDVYAPLIFVNGADAESAKMFTLAHELAHVWLGGEGISGFEGIFPGSTDIESFCDKAAAEFLVPAREMHATWSEVRHQAKPFENLARRFKVSPIVIGRRALDLGLVGRDDFFEFYRSYTDQERRKPTKTGGGDFYKNQNTRVGELFASHVVRAALEGRLGFKRAYELTGLNGGAFQEYAQRLGFVL